MEAMEINIFVEKLSEKLANVAQEVADIQEQLQQLRESTKIEFLPQTAEEKRTERLERVRLQKEKLRPIISEMFEKMGIRGEPIGAENVQKMIADCGIDPEDNEFSRGIIAMREE